MIKRLLRRWLDVSQPEDGLAETLAITIRCARRCAYDLSHAADLVPATGWMAPLAERFQSKAAHWQSLFSSGASMKDYRLHLQGEIDAQAETIKKLRSELRTLGHSGYLSNEVLF